MRLTITGSIDLGNGYSARRTNNEDWYVSMRDRAIGYTQDLTEAQALAEKDRADRLAKVAQHVKPDALPRMRELSTDEFLSAVENITKP